MKSCRRLLHRTIQLGDTHAISRVFSLDDVRNFAALVGDSNPIHLDVNAARAAGFDQCICHGVLVGSLFSTIMGMHLPGPQSVYLQQSFSFVRPVLVGEEVTAKVTVREFNRHKSLIWLDTVVTKMEYKNKIATNAGVGEEVICVTGAALGMCKVVQFVGDSPWTFVRDIGMKVVQKN